MKLITLNAALFCAALGLGAARSSAGELLLNGTFTLTPILSSGFSGDVGRSGSGATYTLNNTNGTNVGWQTTEAGARFEVWAPGEQGSPANVGNTLELANNSTGATIYQTTNSVATNGSRLIFSFGYAPRDSGQDQFTAQLVDVTRGTTLFSQSFNPTGSFAVNQTFSTTLSFTPGDVLRVNFIDQNTFNGVGANSVHIDNVSVNQVPEPTTSAALGTAAILGLWTWMRRRRSATL